MTRIMLSTSNDCLASDYTIHHVTISNYVKKELYNIYCVCVSCVLCLVSYQKCEYSRTFLFSLQIGNCTTPLQLACLDGHSAAVDSLLSHGAAVDQLSGVSQLYVQFIPGFVSRKWLY